MGYLLIVHSPTLHIHENGEVDDWSINIFPFPATICPSLTNLEGEETFEATMLGQAEEVVQERVCDDELILVKK